MSRLPFGLGSIPDAMRKAGCIALALNGAAVLLFGVVAILIAGDQPFVQSAGVASIGMGTFGLVVALIPYRRGERWAWFLLWYYPLFWGVHLLGGLPPGKDHIHQVLFIILSVAGLLLPVRAFFPR